MIELSTTSSTRSHQDWMIALYGLVTLNETKDVAETISGASDAPGDDETFGAGAAQS